LGPSHQNEPEKSAGGPQEFRRGACAGEESNKTTCRQTYWPEFMTPCWSKPFRMEFELFLVEQELPTNLTSVALQWVMFMGLYTETLVSG